MHSNTDLRWHWAGDLLTLHLGPSKRPLATIVPDEKYPAMFRVKLPDGRLTDMANMSWTKERAIALVLDLVNASATVH